MKINSIYKQKALMKMLIINFYIQVDILPNSSILNIKEITSKKAKIIY